MSFLKQYGIKDIEFTGGEPTLNPHFLYYVESASKKFRHVACISNGWKLADYDQMRYAKEAGLNEILFSLHGYDQETHESITERDTSFHRILAAIHNAKQLGIIVRINTTVCSLNVKTLSKHIDLINKIEPTGINFLPVNYWSDNNTHRETASYEEISNCIKECIDLLSEKIEFINVRYIPFCYMKGYESYVSDWGQRQYDLWDWNNTVGEHFLTEEEKEGIIKNTDRKYAELYKMRRHSYYKKKECMDCALNPICDGLEKQVEANVYPYQGDVITNPLNFRKDYCNIERYKEVLNGCSYSHRIS